VRDGRDRERIFVEGVRLCEEAIGSIQIEKAFFADNTLNNQRIKKLLAKLENAGSQTFVVASNVLDSISDTRTSQGVIALARRPGTNRETFTPLDGTPLLVILHKISNPSNAGATLRVAEAAGANGVIATVGSTDLLSPRSLRGSMGSAFRLPLWTGATFSEAIEWCRERGISTVAAFAGASKEHTRIDWKGPCAVIVGPEAEGLSQDELDLANECVRIPMRAPVESLNVAVALGILLFESARQRAPR